MVTIFVALALIAAIAIGVPVVAQMHQNNRQPGNPEPGISSNSNGLQIAFVKSCDSEGVEKDVFLHSDDVYVVIKTTGTGSMTVHIYLVENEAWKEGTPMSDFTGGVEEISLSGDGPTVHGPFLIWSHDLAPGEYDIVVDENNNGIGDPGEKVDNSDVIAGIFVIPELGTLMVMVASFGAMAGLAAKRLRVKC